MDRLLAVVRREYMETVKTKAFAVSTVLVPLLMGGLMFLPALLAHSKPDEPTRLAVVDRTGRLFAELDRELATDPNEDFLKEGQRRYELVDASSSARMPPSDPSGGGGSCQARPSVGNPPGSGRGSDRRDPAGRHRRRQ